MSIIAHRAGVVSVPAVAAGGISFVGEATAEILQGGDATPISISLPGGVLENDIVVVCLSCDAALNDGGGVDPAYSYTDIYFTGTNPSPAYQLAYKRMGSTPDTDVQIIERNNRSQPVIVQVWRGIDATTALDVSVPTVATNSNSYPAPPAITSVTDGCLIFIWGSLDDQDDSANTAAPSGYSNFTAFGTTQGIDTDCTAMVASLVQSSLGTETPGAFTGSVTDAVAAGTVAFRPA